MMELIYLIIKVYPCNVTSRIHNPKPNHAKSISNAISYSNDINGRKLIYSLLLVIIPRKNKKEKKKNKNKKKERKT